MMDELDPTLGQRLVEDAIICRPERLAEPLNDALVCWPHGAPDPRWCTRRQPRNAGLLRTVPYGVLNSNAWMHPNPLRSRSNDTLRHLDHGSLAGLVTPSGDTHEELGLGRPLHPGGR